MVTGFNAADSISLRNPTISAAKLKDEYTFTQPSAKEAVTELDHQECVDLFSPKHFQDNFEDSDVVYDRTADQKGVLSKWIVKILHGLHGHRTIDNVKDIKILPLVSYYNTNLALCITLLTQPKSNYVKSDLSLGPGLDSYTRMDELGHYGVMDHDKSRIVLEECVPG